MNTGRYFERVVSGETNPAYVAFHRPRFRFAIEVLRSCGAGNTSRILDVGPSALTQIIADEFCIRPHSLGLEPECETERFVHYQVDLNAVHERMHWRAEIGPYDIVVFSEVIEHLYAAPEFALQYLHRLLVPDGFLLLQTPNAVSLRKRVKMAVGRNPFERIRTARDNPGHFREYTKDELYELLDGAGFSVDRVWIKHYFDVRYALHEYGNERPRILVGGLKNFIYGKLPAALREGITVLAHRRR